MCISQGTLTTGHRITDPSPLTPSAGQTLTLGQMDNGLHALSPPDHTLLLPALMMVVPFTSAFALPLSSPSSTTALLLIALTLRSAPVTTYALCVLPLLFFPSSSSTPPSILSYFSPPHTHTHCVINLFHFPLSIHPHPGASFLGGVYQNCYTSLKARFHEIIRI